ncbi:MAG: hypothetical protein JO023_05035 [Chloroflexi bacterium]|nr:hypothetical protein [Chloroflexota bacterium]
MHVAKRARAQRHAPVLGKKLLLAALSAGLMLIALVSSAFAIPPDPC